MKIDILNLEYLVSILKILKIVSLLCSLLSPHSTVWMLLGNLSHVCADVTYRYFCVLSVLRSLLTGLLQTLKVPYSWCQYKISTLSKYYIFKCVYWVQFCGNIWECNFKKIWGKTKAHGEITWMSLISCLNVCVSVHHLSVTAVHLFAYLVRFTYNLEKRMWRGQKEKHLLGCRKNSGHLMCFPKETFSMDKTVSEVIMEIWSLDFCNFSMTGWSSAFEPDSEDNIYTMTGWYLPILPTTALK